MIRAILDFAARYKFIMYVCMYVCTYVCGYILYDKLLLSFLMSAISSPQTPLGSLQRSPDPLAGFKGAASRQEGNG